MDHVPGRRLKVWRAQIEDDGGLPPGRLDGRVVGTGDGRLALERSSPRATVAWDAAAWINGARPEPAEGLG